MQTNLKSWENRIKLFCFPYAGGSSTVYHQWKSLLGDNIELRPIELAGRGRRIGEDMYKNLEEVVDDVFQLIRGEIQQSPYMLYGHSMGALITYELAQKINDFRLPKPVHLFFSGKGAPHVKRLDKKKYHLLDEKAFREEVINLGGTPPELFEHPELMELLLPLLKNDFRIAETYSHAGSIRPFDQDITVLLGREDDLTTEQCEEWAKHTSEKCQFHYFPGGHFFINNEAVNITQIIKSMAVKEDHLLPKAY